MSLFGQNIMAQSVNPSMVFDEETFDYGKIDEKGGSVEHKFVFTNTGSTPIIINNVSASCGCTNPDWSKNPVAPGGKGFVSAVFNPLGRPGIFNKSITITSNAENSPVIIHILGEVIEKLPTIEEKYRYVMDEIRLNTSNVHFSDIFSNETKTMEIGIVNTSDKNVEVTFDKNRNIPPYITTVIKPQTLKPGDVGTIFITYNATLKNDWDYVYDRIFLSVNGVYNPNNKITVSAVIKEKFTEEQLKNPPAIEFLNDMVYDFGTIKQGDKIEYSFNFKNTGKTDLIIRKTKASCGCTAISPQDKVIKPGQESNIKVIFDSNGKSGTQTKTITVITNIPGKLNGQDLSVKILTLKGVVETQK